jgi:putative ABC transport system permease protein
MQFLLQDVRFAIRMLWRNAGFAALIVLILALGIGPNSAIFSMVSAVLLRPLPIADPDRVVIVWETWKQKGFDQTPASANNYLDWKAQNRVFDKMAAAFTIAQYGLNVTAGGEPERVSGGQASAGFVEVLGIKPYLGRGFRPEEDRPGGAPAALVSYRFWERRLHASPAALGRAVTVDGIPRTVVGVLPRDFTMLGPVDVWIPIAMDPAQNKRLERTYGAIAHLKPGVTVAQAQAEMNVIAKRLEQQYPETNQGWGARVMPIHQLLSGGIAPALFVLLGAVGLLLLLACANVANLLLARAAARRREVAIRTAMGAGRMRIIRQLLTENLILSLLGGAAGLLLGGWTIGLLRGVVPEMLALMKQMSLDGRVIAFTFGLSAVTGMVFGIVPALKISRTDLNDALKSGGRSVVGSSMGARSTLLVAEVALAMVLSVAAGLLAKSFSRLMSVNPGLRTANVLTMQFTLPWLKYSDEQKRTDFYKNLVRRVETLPGVQSAGAIRFLPFRDTFLNQRMGVLGFQVVGQPPVRSGEEPLADYRVVTPKFLETMAVRLREGRMLTDRDTLDAPRVAIVNEALVRKHLEGRNPIGSRLKIAPWTGPAAEIVGVVPDVKLYGLDARVEPAIFVPHAQEPGSVMSLVVHTAGDPQALSGAIRRQVREMDPEQPVADVRTMDAVVGDSLVLRRISVLLVGSFAGLALVLATVGIYGLTSYSVSQRKHEIGLRMALGAQRADVFRLMVGRGLAVALIGVGIGLAGAFLVTGMLKSLLFGITTTDPAVMAGVPLLLLAVSALAAYVPARRAAQVDPMVALRYE